MQRTKFSEQVRSSVNRPKEKKEMDGNTEIMISTGSTLLDLAISGTRVRGGGLPGGILVEIFGASAAGKTVLLSEIAGNVKEQGGEIMFRDPEARLNKQFAKLFGLDVDLIDYDNPNTIPEVFGPIRDWKPKNKEVINGIFADSIAALSTDMEMDGTDKYGGRRGKEFSEEMRKTCRVITSENYLMVMSNQIRDIFDAKAFSEKTKSPGGHAIEFYPSLRLKINRLQKIGKEITIKGKKIKRIVGVQSKVEVYKSSVDVPFRDATISIIFNYGVDDIRENLMYLKSINGWNMYQMGKDDKLHKSIEEAIAIVEEEDLEDELRETVIDTWEEVEKKFVQRDRKPKH